MEFENDEENRMNLGDQLGQLKGRRIRFDPGVIIDKVKILSIEGVLSNP